MELIERFDAELDKALRELEEARNVSNKADALIMVKELIMASTMYVDLERRKCETHKLEVEIAKSKEVL